MIDQATIQRVLDATDIVDVVKEFVTLRKAGVNYKGLCPFHNEKTPSFTVSPSKQLCKCFSCGKGGNAVHFLMELEHMTYPEAIKWLGNRYGIEVREKELTDEERERQSERESMFVVNEWANRYFQDLLHNDVDGVAKGLAYFRQRGFRDDIIRKFALGYSLERRDAMAQAALAKGYDEKYLLATGLCFKTEDGQLLDRYHGRVIFPVLGVSGKTVAFGGRILNTEKQKHVGKYVNSPESIIYSKSHELYGLYQSKNAIVRQNRCYLVEGYTDVISMHQCGVENVVASSGTSLTEGQIRLIHRFTDNITVLYDGDAAGIKASLRGIDMLLAEGMNIKVLLLPDGDDPDSFARKHRADELQAYVESHQVDFIRFKTNLLQKDAAGDPIKRAELITDVVKSISVIPNRIVRQMYVHECAENLQVSEALIINEINKMLAVRSSGPKSTNHAMPEEAAAVKAEQAEIVQQNLSGDVVVPEEKLLITMVIRYGNMRMPMDADESVPASTDPTLPDASTPTGNGISVAEFIEESILADGMQLRNSQYKQILNEALEHVKTNVEWVSLPYFTNHPDPAISALAAEVAMDRVELSQMQKQQFVSDDKRLSEIVPRLLYDFKHSVIKEKLNSLLSQLRHMQASNNQTQAESLMREYMELSKIERVLAQILGDRIIIK